MWISKKKYNDLVDCVRKLEAKIENYDLEKVLGDKYLSEEKLVEYTWGAFMVKDTISFRTKIDEALENIALIMKYFGLQKEINNSIKLVKKQSKKK